MPEGRYEIQGTCLESQARLLTGDKIGVHLLRMPHHVSADRVFTHAGYYLEHHGKPFPVETSAAWRVGDHAVLFS